jgi:hypothetical protein
MSNLRKALTWILTSSVALVIGTVALVANKSALADTNNSLWPWHPHWPPHHHPTPPAVPEVNSGLVLLPIVFAVLLFCTRQLLRRRSASR